MVGKATVGIAKKQILYRQAVTLHIPPQVPAAFMFFMPFHQYTIVRLATQLIERFHPFCVMGIT